MTHEDHEVLCGLENAYGEVFRWLDMQAHDHGPQPLAALQVAVEGQPFAELTSELIKLETMQPLGRVIDDPEASHEDLRRALLAVRIDVIDLELKQLQSLPKEERAAHEAELIRRQFALKRELHLLKSQDNRIM